MAAHTHTNTHTHTYTYTHTHTHRGATGVTNWHPEMQFSKKKNSNPERSKASKFQPKDAFAFT